jgi:CDP-paratose 2-epimerase
MVLQEIRRITGTEPAIRRGDWRPGDQFYFVADTRRLQGRLGWSARIGWRKGLSDLAAWLRGNRGFEQTHQERLTA